MKSSKMNQSNPLWVKDLSNYTPAREGHWPPYCAGFNLSTSGRVWLTDNNPIIIDEPNKAGILAPCHRDIVDGEGDDMTAFSGLYCYNPKDKTVTLWLYGFAEEKLCESMKQGLKALVGVDKITENTIVYSNDSRKALFKLSEI
tara:strand:- start:54 stop:485 length:432 start_codon:yes stop_codon:yes gene_type:complete